MRSRGETQAAAAALRQLLTAAGPLTISPLTRGREAEVLDFLSARPLRTFYLAGLVRDNGLESPHNRGTFYGCRDEEGRLTGVALVGHAIVFETESDAALAAFARLAQDHPLAHMVAGTPDEVESFWAFYTDSEREARRVCREVLLARPTPADAAGADDDLRPAAPEDLADVMRVQAQMAFDESGVSPLETDPEGFRRRCARRIEMGRVWVVRREGRLVFKADVMADTPEVNYLEGVYVSPEERGRGLGASCVAQLARRLAPRTGALCVFVNEENRAAQRLFRRAGFTPEGSFEMIYLRLPN